MADAGFSNVVNLKETMVKDTNVIVPTQRQALHQPKYNPFGKDKFRYDPELNQYICPTGNFLRYSYYFGIKDSYVYRMSNPEACRACVNFGICTNSERGRSILRLKEEELREKLEARYASDEGQAIYRKRKERAELPFGHIKRNLNGGAFLMRGLGAVRAEWSLLANAFNITRMTTLMGGVGGLIERLKKLDAGQADACLEVKSRRKVWLTA